MILTLLPHAPLAQEGDGFAWRQHPGDRIDPATPLRDEAGHLTTLGAAALPFILDLGYFHCPSLCGVVRADVYAALQGSGMALGRDVALLAVSIDPAETPAEATQAKAADLARFPASLPAGAHYLTAGATDLAAIERAVGFQARWDPGLKQFMHPAGIVVLTPAGRISSYLLGVGYSGGDLRAAILRAGAGGIAPAALPILLLCFHFDSTTGRYTLAVEKLLRLLAGLTVLTVSGLVIALHRKRTKTPGSA